MSFVARSCVAASLAFAGSAAVSAATPLPIAPGEVLTVAVLPGGAMRLLRRDSFDGAMNPEALLDARQARPPGPAEVRFRLGQLTGKPDMLLFVENGYDAALTYRAGICRKGRPQLEPTSVCTVPPGKAAFELWPYRFDGIVVAAPVIAGDVSLPVTCE